MTKSIGYTAGCLLAFCLATTQARAESDNGFPRPLSVANQTPLSGIFGIPAAQGTSILGRGNTQWDTNLNIASNFAMASTGNESILFDGETTRFSIQARYGINDDWNIGLEIPWIRHGGGSLDSFIINWHDFWGFPQGGRDDAVRDRIAYRYERNGVTHVNIDSSTSGVGDITLSAQKHIFDGADRRAVFHTQVKLPTGDAGKLTGSEATDVSAGIEVSRRWGPAWYSMYRAGVVYTSNGDVLPELRRNWLAYGGFEVSWHPIDALVFRVQFNAHTSPYQDTGLDELSQWSGMLAAGGSWYITRNTALELSVMEDVPNTDVVSDVTFQLRLRSRL